MKALNILIVEDGQSQREMLRDFLIQEGHNVQEAENGEKGVDWVRNGHFDLLLLDYKMPGMDGMQVLTAVKDINPEIDVVIITAYGTIETAVEAMKAGAIDYITKPIEFDELLLLVERVAERRILIKENEILKQELREKGVTAEQIVYRSPKMEALINMAGRVAPSRATILIQGESGTGKELLARLIHQLSPRSGRAMLAVNCGALHENLLESELFGHEKGAFTGASARRIGRFEEADGSTLFLDEIGEFPFELQAKLLNVLQDRQIKHLGGLQAIPVDVRIVAATNMNLEQMVRERKFREDLYYRLNVIPVFIPPLRERREDILPMIKHFLKVYNQNYNTGKNLSIDALNAMLNYDWPGNVREVRNAIERIVVMSADEIIARDDLPGEIRKAYRLETAAGAFPPGAAPAAHTLPTTAAAPLKETLAAAEKALIRRALESSATLAEAARLLKIDISTLTRKKKKYNV